MDSYLVNLPESILLLTTEEQYLNTVQFSAEDKWIKKFFFSFIKDGSPDEPKNKTSKDSNMITNFQFTRGKPLVTRELLKTTHPSEGRMDIESEEGLSVGTKGYQGITSENILENLIRKDNIDILAIKAKNAFMKYDIQTAYKLSKEYTFPLSPECSRETPSNSRTCRSTACVSSRPKISRTYITCAICSLRTTPTTPSPTTWSASTISSLATTNRLGSSSRSPITSTETSSTLG
jgi:hypothetical protein